MDESRALSRRRKENTDAYFVDNYLNDPHNITCLKTLGSAPESDHGVYLAPCSPNIPTASTFNGVDFQIQEESIAEK